MTPPFLGQASTCPESAAPAHLYRASVAAHCELERLAGEVEELRAAVRQELGDLRQELRAVLSQHAEERGARRTWQLLAAAVPTVLVVVDLLSKVFGWWR